MSHNGCHIFLQFNKSLFVYTNTNLSCLNVETKCSLDLEGTGAARVFTMSLS